MKNMSKTIKKSPPKRKLLRTREAATQTDAEQDSDSDIALITGDDEPPRKYFKLLSEERQKIIDKLVAENEKLNDRIDLLEQENVELESMLVDARKIADYICSIPDENDESGIVHDDHEEEGESPQH